MASDECQIYSRCVVRSLARRRQWNSKWGRGTELRNSSSFLQVLSMGKTQKLISQLPLWCLVKWKLHPFGQCMCMYLSLCICVWMFIYVCRQLRVYVFCIYIYMYVYEYISKCVIFICKHCMCMYIYAHISICLRVDAWTYMCVCIYVCLFVYACAYVCRFIYIYNECVCI